MDWDLFDEKPEKHFQKDMRDIKRSIRVECEQYHTRIFLVAIAIDSEKNHMILVPADRGSPVVQEAYDSIRDGYVIAGVDFIEVGRVPVSYRVICDDQVWSTEIPLPSSVIRRYLDDKQKQTVDDWKSKFDKDKYFFQSIQTLEY